MPVLTHNKIAEAAEASTGPRPDEELVRECISGNAEAWSELIDKYKNLIFSVPIKNGFSRDEAADIFQEVCLGLLSELRTIREPRALAKWLLTVTAHKCFHRRRVSNRFVNVEPEAMDALRGDTSPAVLQLMAEAEREQALRQAITGLPGRCRQLVKMLFFETPSRPYRDVAQDLNIAVGSIGFIRQRCLEKLRKSLEKLNFAGASEALAADEEADGSE
jgi:RNA polymerase sigma factor (sigma-70 family)